MANSVAFWQGNTAMAHGALAAGCNFFGGYPITPSTEIAEVMAEELPKKGGHFMQMEDEIGGIAAAINFGIAQNASRNTAKIIGEKLGEEAIDILRESRHWLPRGQ